MSEAELCSDEDQESLVQGLSVQQIVHLGLMEGRLSLMEDGVPPMEDGVSLMENGVLLIEDGVLPGPHTHSGPCQGRRAREGHWAASPQVLVEGSLTRLLHRARAHCRGAGPLCPLPWRAALLHEAPTTVMGPGCRPDRAPAGSLPQLMQLLPNPLI